MLTRIESYDHVWFDDTVPVYISPKNIRSRPLKEIHVDLGRCSQTFTCETVAQIIFPQLYHCSFDAVIASDYLRAGQMYSTRGPRSYPLSTAPISAQFTIKSPILA